MLTADTFSLTWFMQMLLLCVNAVLCAGKSEANIVSFLGFLFFASLLLHLMRDAPTNLIPLRINLKWGEREGRKYKEREHREKDRGLRRTRRRRRRRIRGSSYEPSFLLWMATLMENVSFNRFLARKMHFAAFHAIYYYLCQ